MGYINLSARVSSSFPNIHHARYHIPHCYLWRWSSIQTTHTTHIDTADAITGLPGVRSPEDIMMPVALQSLVLKVLEDKEAIAHPVASEEGCKVGRLALPSILKKRKVRAAKKIFKETIPLVPVLKRNI
jgi:hypothetical protein